MASEQRYRAEPCVVHIKAGERHWHGDKADTTTGHITITAVVTYGSLWISSNVPSGYAGVLVFTPAARLPGRIWLMRQPRLWRPKRDRLCITASQSLYVIQPITQGAAHRGEPQSEDAQ
jgi:hypothetical protein